MWATLKTILDVSSPTEAKTSLMNFIKIYKPKIEADEDIPYIKDTVLNLVSSPITRNDGYFLLDAVTNSNPTVYIQNWGPLITTKLKEPDNWESKRLTLKILKRMVLNFSGNPSLYDAFQLFVPDVVPLLLRFPKGSEKEIGSCSALATCMQCLPGIVGSFCEEIEVFLMEHATSVDYKSEEGVAECFAAMPLCLEKRAKTKSSYVEIWLKIFLKVLNTLQSILNSFLKNCKVEGSQVSTDGLALLHTPQIDEENDESVLAFKRTKLFSTLCRCLSKMMSVHTDANLSNLKVKVPVPELLKCLERIFRVFDHIKENENPFLSITYPVLMISALSVLESLIVNFTIIEQSGNVVAFLNKLIVITVSDNMEYWSWYVRSSTWKVADAWLKANGSKSAYNIVNNKFLIRELLKDIVPEQGCEEAERKGKGTTMDSREECCKEALNVLNSMLIFGGTFLDKDLLNEISSTVLKVSCKVQQSSHPAKRYVYPYTNNDCRWNLYQCLLQASLSDPMQTKYVKQAINIFRFATKDPHMQVRTISYSALNTFRFYINPKKPLPEAKTPGGNKAPPPDEEAAQSGWESGFNWHTQNESSEDRSMDVSPPSQVEYHNSLGSDSRRDATPARVSPHYADGLGGTQCNGGSEPKQPSHSVDSESNDIKEYSIDDDDDEEMAEDTPPTQGPIIETLKPAQVAPPQDKSGKRRETAADSRSDGGESQRTGENGLYGESEDGEENSGEEYDEEGEDEEEENNEGYAPQYAPSRYSPVSDEIEQGAAKEYYPEKKRPRIANEEEQSSEEEDYGEAPPSKLLSQESAQEEIENARLAAVHMMASNSPTVAEMCQDFVLAEPEEIR